MPDTADHRADMMLVTLERRRAGRSQWDEVIRLGDIWDQFTDGPDSNFEPVRDQVVARMRASRWFAQADPLDDRGLHEILDNLAAAPDAEEFDAWWDEMYDLADRGPFRVFVDVHSTP